MEPLPVDSSSLAMLLRAAWIQQALSDPCALHTTLYAASAHVDAFRGVKDNYMTLYHHTIALRLLQEKISDPDATFSESLLACVAPLVFFSVSRCRPSGYLGFVAIFLSFQALLGDKGSSQIHKMALMQMIKAQGGLEHLTLGPFLSGLITVCVGTYYTRFLMTRLVVSNIACWLQVHSHRSHYHGLHTRYTIPRYPSHPTDASNIFYIRHSPSSNQHER
jgi:hypothetical protein